MHPLPVSSEGAAGDTPVVWLLPLSLTDHCPAAQSSPAASLGCHLPALCPTAPTALLQCPVHLHSPSASAPPALVPTAHLTETSAPSSTLPHSNPTALHPHSTGSSVSAPPHPKVPFPTSLAVLFANCAQHLCPLDTALSPTLCHGAGLHPKACLEWVGRGPALAWLSCTPSLPLLYP